MDDERRAAYQKEVLRDRVHTCQAADSRYSHTWMRKPSSSSTVYGAVARLSCGMSTCDLLRKRAKDCCECDLRRTYMVGWSSARESIYTSRRYRRQRAQEWFSTDDLTQPAVPNLVGGRDSSGTTEVLRRNRQCGVNVRSVQRHLPRIDPLMSSRALW